MKLATYAAGDGKARIGVVEVDSGQIVQLHAFDDMLDLIERGDEGLSRANTERERATVTHELRDVRLLPPLRPLSIRDCLTFEEHLVRARTRRSQMTGEPFSGIPPVWYDQPIYYKGNRFTVVGHEAEVIWPAYSDLMDYELELACVIGVAGRNIPREKALDHIFGYTIFNDTSARDALIHELPGQLGPAKGKDFDTGNVLGPWLVTSDEIGDPHSLEMVGRVNGEEWSRGNASAMQHGFDSIVTFLSQGETLYPGEVIGSGTVGSGCGMELGRFLNDGDTVELEIERIGVLRNKFVMRHSPAQK